MWDIFTLKHIQANRSHSAREHKNASFLKKKKKKEKKSLFFFFFFPAGCHTPGRSEARSCLLKRTVSLLLSVVPGSVTGQPGGVRGLLAGKHRLYLRYVVVTEVTICHVRSRLVVAGHVSHVGDDVLLGQDSHRQHGYEPQGLPSLVSHQAHRTLVDHPVQGHQVVILAVLQAHEVVLQVGLQLALLLANVGEVDEEAGAHVALQGLHLWLRGSPEAPHQQVTVLEQAPAPDLFGVPGADDLMAQVVQGLAEVPVHALAHDGGMEGLGHRVLRALVEEQQGVQLDLKRVHAELKLPPERVHELQLHVLAPVVGQGDEAPAVRVVTHLHHLLHIGFLFVCVWVRERERERERERRRRGNMK